MQQNIVKKKAILLPPGSIEVTKCLEVKIGGKLKAPCKFCHQAIPKATGESAYHVKMIHGKNSLPMDPLKDFLNSTENTQSLWLGMPLEINKCGCGAQVESKSTLLDHLKTDDNHILSVEMSKFDRDLTTLANAMCFELAFRNREEPVYKQTEMKMQIALKACEAHLWKNVPHKLS